MKNYGVFVKILISTVLVAVVFLVTPLVAFSNCDSYFVEALRTRIDLKEESKISDILFSSSCRFDSRGNNTNGSFLSPYGYGTFGNSNHSVREACYRGEREFFSTYKKELMYSYLPDDAYKLLQGCFEGVSLKVSRTGDTMIIKAAYVSTTDGKLAKVLDFDIEPKNAIRCSAGETFRRNQELIPGGTEIQCQIVREENFSIKLNTTSGSKSVSLMKKPEITLFNWDLVEIGGPRFRDKSFACKDLKRNLIVDKVYAAYRGGPGNRTTALGSCITRHGVALVRLAESEPYVHKDKWGYRNVSRGTVQCTKNNVDIGQSFHVGIASGLSSNANNITNFCAATHGIEQ